MSCTAVRINQDPVLQGLSAIFCLFVTIFFLNTIFPIRDKFPDDFTAMRFTTQQPSMSRVCMLCVCFFNIVIARTCLWIDLSPGDHIERIVDQCKDIE